jgi:hypothetical protein
MSKANAALYPAADSGQMPTPPDFSKPSYVCDRGKLVELVKLGEAGDVGPARLRHPLFLRPGAGFRVVCI